MRSLIIIAAVFLFSCTKDPAQTCYACQYTENNTHYGYTVCGDEPAPYKTDSAGNIIFITCRKK